MKAGKFIRIFSIFGLLMLLMLQYLWFQNSYVLMEHDVLDKSEKILLKSVEEELFWRLSTFSNSLKIIDNSGDYKKNKNETVVSDYKINQTNDIKKALQHFTNSMGKPCNIKTVDSLFSSSIAEAISFTPAHTIKIVSAKDREKGKHSKFNLYAKITDEQYAEVVLVNPLGSILQQAQMIVMVSILLVIIIGIVLLYLLRSTLRENRFVSFIKDYTHALTHELKTPISGIYMASSQLESGIFEEKPEVRKRYYAMCRESSSKLLSTVDRILLVAKAEHSRITTSPVETEIKPFIEKIAKTHSQNNFRRKEVELTTVCEPESLKANIDPFLIENVLNNLIDNAMKYSNQQVSISIHAAQAENKLEIQVKDTGFGIDRNEVKHIFDNFERGNRIQGKGIDGFGIGLNYVQKVIRAHKGTIRVQSQEGLGSVFQILLPF
jgi:two-component system, OmpR family, phosphate regulon sensor histidine kinase PhoR